MPASGNAMPKNMLEQSNEMAGSGRQEGAIVAGLRAGFEEFDFAIPLTLLETEARHRRLSEVRKLAVNESGSLPVKKCIYERLPCSMRNGKFERAFIEGCESDPGVLAFCAVSASCHDFVRLRYINRSGTLGFYYPDFLVRTARAIYVVEAGKRQPPGDPDVQRKLRAAAAWCARVNSLHPSQRSGLPWHYVLLLENAFHEWRSKGAALSELLAFARLRPLERHSV